MTKKLPLPTSVEMLREEFLNPMGITPYQLAKDIHVPQTRISAILAGERTITPDTGLRLDRYFGLSEGWWVRLQLDCDLRKAQRELGARIAREVKPREVAAAWRGAIQLRAAGPLLADMPFRSGKTGASPSGVWL